MVSSKHFLVTTWLFAIVLSYNITLGNLIEDKSLLVSKRWSDHAKHFFRTNKRSEQQLDKNDPYYSLYKKRQAPGQSVPAGITVVEPPAGTTFAEQIIDQMTTNPVGAAELVQQIPYIANNASGITQFNYQWVSGDSNEAQLPWNKAVPFLPNANTTEDSAGGWQMIPQVEGFTLNRSWEIVPGAIMPFYSTANIDPAQIKRAVITYPGEPRDAWLYADLYRNALQVVYDNETYGVAQGSVLIITPFWGNQLDYAAGSLQPNEIYFYGAGWMAGEDSRGPNLTHSLTAYEIMDNFTDMLFDKAQYPNLNQVVVAGHSMGGQASQRYAVLKKQKAYDPNMSWWVANPGSWAYLSDDRPYYNASCNTTYNTWEYGLGPNYQNMTKYARYAVETDLDWVVKTYINRNVHYALGLLDNGAGDTHCEARDQGGNHLDRGSQFAIHLYQVNNNTWPASQTVDFIGNTSHQDFAMISSNTSLYWMFVNNYNTSFPEIVPWNPVNTSGIHHNITIPEIKPYATHGNEELATGLLGGSLVLIALIFGLAPFAFRSNFDEDEFQKVSGGRDYYNHAKIQPFYSSTGKEAPFPTRFNAPLSRQDTFDSQMTNNNMPLIDVSDHPKSFPPPPTYR